ncbi:MAG: hypothetical protein JW863_15285 [Chitinispirillaceae bacterium]|nr:hypothetical protein [Chitinispirillaceae bacterium]
MQRKNLTIRNAVGDPEKLAAAKEKFKAYHGIPMLTGFDKVAAFIEKERAGKSITAVTEERSIIQNSQERGAGPPVHDK